MRLHLFAMVFSVFVVGTVAAPRSWAGDPENLFKKTAIGDWAAYKIATNGLFGDQPLTFRNDQWKLTVSVKNDKEVVVKPNAPQTPGLPPVPDIKIDLTKAFDPTRISNYANWITPENPLFVGVSEEKTKEGDKQTIEVGKTKYECKTVVVARTYTVSDKKVVGTCTWQYKLWICPDAPLGGLVKMEETYTTSFGTFRQAIILLDDSGKKE